MDVNNKEDGFSGRGWGGKEGDDKVCPYRD